MYTSSVFLNVSIYKFRRYRLKRLKKTELHEVFPELCVMLVVNIRRNSTRMLRFNIGSQHGL
jgi:hypothetical protein